MWKKEEGYMKKRILSYSIVLCMLISLLTCDWCTETVYASNTANEIVSIAQREIGNGYSKYTQYTGPIGGRYDYAWCASFVSWCGNQAGVSCIGKTASCYSQYNYMISHGGQRVSSPQAGDIVFFYCNNCSGTANQWCHIGIMVDSSTSIDGNYNNKVSYDRSYSHYGSLGYKHSNGISKIYVRPNYGQATALLPGTVDSSWNVPTSVSASHRITTYDQWGNAESNHYIDPGDSCYITEVYTNGFVKVQYPVSGGKRWAYAKASDFSISKKQENKLPDTRLSVWFSLSPMGDGVSNMRFNDRVYLCYRLETQDGKLLDGSLGNYKVKETIYRPDGTSGSFTYGNNNNWISECFSQGGTYRGVVEISGDYTGSVEVSYNMPQPYKVILTTWFSDSPMGKEINSVEKGKEYYYCYTLVANEKGYYNQSINTDYKAAQEIYAPNGIKIGTWTKDRTDHNYLKFKATQSGNYNGSVTLTGVPHGTMKATCVCKESAKLESINISKYPTKISYVVGETISTAGMTVTAKYTDGKTKNVTSYKVTSGDTSKIGTRKVYISYSEGGVTKEASYTIQVKEKSHMYGSWIVTKRATCTTDGTEQRICSLCRKTETRTVKATGHKYTNKTIAPTSTTKGYTLHTCSVCGYSYKDNYTDAKKQLQSIAISAKPGKTTYNINDTIDTSGLKVVATYTDGSRAEVKGWKIGGSTAKAGTVSVRVSYTESGITKAASYEIQVKEKETPKETVYVTYKTNGGSMSQTKQSGTKGSTIQLLNERPAKSVNVTFQPNGGDQNPSPVSLSQTFKCWRYNSSTTMSTSYYPGSSLTLTQNCTLYAQYNDAKLTTLPVISREGYVFDGWYTPNNTLAYEGMTITSDTVLIAHWTETSVDEDDDKNDALAVGDELETDQAIYTITKTNGEYCVEYSELFDDDVTVTYIPDTVAIDGVVYKVTSIGEKAFYKNTALKKIVIGSCVKKISSKAFYGCTSLNNIVINSTKISNGKVGANAFKKVNKNVKVYVPALKYKAYKKLLKKAGVGSKAKIYKKIKTR